MKTVLTALGAMGTCVAARCCLSRTNRGPKDYAGGHVRITTLWNEKGAFGLNISRNMLLSLSGAALGTVWTQRRRNPVGAGLILGGGISNLLERLRQGKVFDYIRFPKAPAPINRYVYNLADFAIFAGTLMMCIKCLRKKRTDR